MQDHEAIDVSGVADDTVAFADFALEVRSRLLRHNFDISCVSADCAGFICVVSNGTGEGGQAEDLLEADRCVSFSGKLSSLMAMLNLNQTQKSDRLS